MSELPLMIPNYKSILSPTNNKTTPTGIYMYSLLNDLLKTQYILQYIKHVDTDSNL